MNAYAGHTPFTEKDIDLFLTQYAQDSTLATSQRGFFTRSETGYLSQNDS